MKAFILSIMLCLGLVFGSGCISNPLKHVQQTVQVESQTVGRAVSPKMATTKAEKKAVATAATTQSPSTKSAVKSVVESESHMLMALGVIGILGGAALIYFGRLTLGIEFIVGGLLVPIIGIIIAKYYLLIILGVIVGLVVTHWTIVKPYVEDIETAVTGLWNDLMNIIHKPTPAPAPITATHPVTGSQEVSGSK